MLGWMLLMPIVMTLTASLAALSDAAVATASGLGAGHTDIARPAARVVRVGRSASAHAPTIAGGLSLVPPGQSERWSVQVEPGTYRERVWVNASMGPVTLLGLSSNPSDTTLIFHCCPKGNGMPHCSNESVAAVCKKQHAESLGNTETLLVEAADFTAANITIANDACGYDASLAAQSQALQANGDRSSFLNVNLWGAQDTIFADGGEKNTNRQYFRDTTINGSCDAIYGTSTMVFEKCDIRMTYTYTADRGGPVGTPHGARLPAAANAAYLFVNSSLKKPLPNEFDYQKATDGKTFLGRPWGPLASVIFTNTWMDSHIAPAGWDDWGHGCSQRASPLCKQQPACECNQPIRSVACWCQNVTYAEYGSHGPGATAAKLKQRVGWSRQLQAGGGRFRHGDVAERLAAPGGALNQDKTQLPSSG